MVLAAEVMMSSVQVRPKARFIYPIIVAGGDAPDEFLSEYSVPRIITQYQGLLLSTRDYYSLSGIITQYQGLSGFLFSFGLDWSNR